ncbi:MAG: SHOCT domain-containing protein [Desulfuromonadaceae bacterium]|nr:SHOCT domain-containing protein [Desulfuromonadaceae bacterium]
MGAGSWTGHFPWMWIFPLGFIIILVLLVFCFRGRCGVAGKPEETPREILDRRYAKGDISREEYLQIKKDLE